MKITSTKLIAATVLAMFFVNNSAKAQSLPESKLKFGIGLDGILPVGNLTNTANFGLGLTPRLQYGVSENVAVTFTTGIYHFFTKEIRIPSGLPGQYNTMENKLDLIPVKAGVKSFVSSNVYFSGEIGVALQVDNGGGGSQFIASPGVGYAGDKWDLGVRYENLSKTGSNSAGFIGLRLAYGFGL
ncbi:hypothetical protein [Mucilaginibacter auburnensis]|uniref:Outer membrane protein with beta-barrel domain n=1 Tax=Mucilaginibacter auburnensis TaxID=1457233 RepID=A0A2H9VME5_9SPHI|nr:hypothetical protein [Mucilaginibacter auburnensis]PJJ79508.1 hypothetical protein CLV57_2642 [Mucilaginibacter auburnensis]